MLKCVPFCGKVVIQPIRNPNALKNKPVPAGGNQLDIPLPSVAVMVLVRRVDAPTTAKNLYVE